MASSLRLAGLLRACLLLLYGVHAAFCDGGYCPGYNTRAGVVDGKINVHLVPHTHDDVGWLKTVDQYYIGSNNSIQVAGVQYILDTVVEKLLENPDRKFIYVEQAFFERWWKQQTRRTQKAVRKLIRDGQLEFINGGYCMHDEATTHYVDMIDQTTLGHRFLKEHFDVVPRVSFQLDPFGHSAVQAYLLTAEAGMDAVFFARADWQDLAKRRKDQTMEFVWRASSTLGESAEVFGGAMHHHYDPPEGFRYDAANPDPPIQDDPSLDDMNVEERVNAFVEACQEQAKQFRTSHIMWAMGEDFAYGNAQTWFKNMDKLIHYVNQDGRVNAFYSTPTLYVRAKHAAKETWPLKTGDFFPYANDAHNFWTGYFTSRPTFKGYVRSSGAFLQAVRQLEAFTGRRSGGPTTDALEKAMAIVQHHDAVAGTQRQHVANDYSKRLYKGEVEATDVFTGAISILTKNLDQTQATRSNKQKRTRRERAMLMETDSQNILLMPETSPTFERCGLLNISYCPATQVDLSSGKTLVVVAYNPLTWTRKEIISLPVMHEGLTVRDARGSSLLAQISPLKHHSPEMRRFYMEAHGGPTAGRDRLAKYNLHFEIEVLPLGFSTYFVSPAPPGSEGAAEVATEEDLSDSVETVSVTGGKNGMQLTFSKDTGRLSHMSNGLTGVETLVDHGYLWYNASNGIEAGPQASGAYIFRPNSSDTFPIWSDSNPVPLSVVRGPLVEEVHQRFGWASQVVRMFRDSSHAEVHYTLGPIPIDDDLGKEVITRFSTNIASNRTFYTDSNGRDYLKRVVDYRSDWELNVTDPVAGNYYPVNAGVYLSDGLSDLSIVVDRSIGATSLRDGELELMLHRRLLYDDHKGVGEALNETVCVGSPPRCQGLSVTGKFYVSLNPRAEAARWRRLQAQRVLVPLQLAFAVQEGGENTWIDNHVTTFSASQGYELPPNVAIITLQELGDKRILLRLAHIFEAGEDAEYSTLATVDLSKVFAHFEVEDVEEMNLTANQKRAEMQRLQWTVEGETSATKGPRPLRGRPHVNGSPVVELGPMEIRTFLITLDRD